MKIILSLFFFTSLSKAFVIQVGETLAFPSSPSSVWAEKNNCLTVTSTSNSTKITGNKKCAVKVKINNQIKKIQVITVSQKNLFEKISQLAKKTPGLKVKIENAQVEVQGFIYKWDTWKKLRDLAEDEESFVVKSVLSEELSNQFQNYINEELQAQGLLSLNVTLKPSLMISISPQQQYQSRYQNYFEKLGIPVTIAKESLSAEPTIQVRIRILEVSKSSSLKFGVRWPDEATFQVLPKAVINSETLQGQIMALESTGEARTLASPTLICKSGKEADFFAGGEYPIKLTGFKEQIQWIKYGVGLKIKPLADSSGRMSLTIETEISNLSAFVDNIPTVETSRVSSHFDISKSQVIALSGILRDQNSSGHEGVPFLKHIPILGSLFSSKKYISKQSELIILVEPQLMNSNTNMARH